MDISWAFVHNKKDDVNLDHYKCHHYYQVSDTCSSSHYLRKEILEELILNEFQQLVSAIHFDEEKLLEELKSRFDIRENKKQNSLQKQLKQAQKRYTEIDIILQKLYEKQLLNGISDERFQKLADNYESEQTELNQQIKELQTILTNQIESTENIDRFMRIIRQYTNVETISTQLVNELIDKIVVHQPTGRDKNRQVQSSYITALSAKYKRSEQKTARSTI